MHVKQILACLVVILLVASPVSPASANSQIAYLLLSEYVLEKELGQEAQIGGLITMLIGTSAVVGAGTMWVFGDEITAWLSTDGQSWDQTTKYMVCGSLTASGIGGLFLGAGMYFSNPNAYHLKYAYVLESQDLKTREVLAAAALADLAAQGRRKRILSATARTAVPVLTICAAILTNVTEGRKWHEEVPSGSVWQIGQLVSGVTDYFSRSEEELLYERYLLARLALEKA